MSTYNIDTVYLYDSTFRYAAFAGELFYTINYYNIYIDTVDTFEDYGIIADFVVFMNYENVTIAN